MVEQHSAPDDPEPLHRAEGPSEALNTSDLDCGELATSHNAAEPLGTFAASEELEESYGVRARQHDEPLDIRHFAKKYGMAFLRWFKRMWIEQFVLCGLIVALIFGGFVPQPGQFLVRNLPWFQSILIGSVFFLTGLYLETEEVKQGFAAWKSMLLGLFVILFVTPLLSLLLVILPLEPREFATGLGVWSLMPTTISAGVIFVREARGSVAVALILILASQILGGVTIPLLLPSLTMHAQDASVSISPWPLLRNFTLNLMTPVLIGKLLREKQVRVRRYLMRPESKQRTRYVMSTMLIGVPWLQISESTSKFEVVGFGDMVLLIVLGILMHGFFLCLNITWITLLRERLKIIPSVRTALVIMCSQKALAVSVPVINMLPPSAGAHALLLVPCIVSHYIQIVIDAWVATKLGKEAAREEAAAARLAARQQRRLRAAAAAAAAAEGGASTDLELGQLAPATDSDSAHESVEAVVPADGMATLDHSLPEDPFAELETRAERPEVPQQACASSSVAVNISATS